jgi:hypothetical protein
MSRVRDSVTNLDPMLGFIGAASTITLKYIRL